MKLSCAAKTTLHLSVRGDTSVAQRAALRGNTEAEITHNAGKLDDDFK